eukprot:9501607-Pyramimonas_sp.AAC.2
MSSYRRNLGGTLKESKNTDSQESTKNRPQATSLPLLKIPPAEGRARLEAKLKNSLGARRAPPPARAPSAPAASSARRGPTRAGQVRDAHLLPLSTSCQTKSEGALGHTK